jgi:glycine oxidase
MHRTHDVIVVGGGAVGAACARELAADGRSVLVLERGGAIGQAWRAAAGMLAPQIEAHADDALFRLGIAAREHYAGLTAALHDTTDIDIGLWEAGITHVACGEAEAAELRRKVVWQGRAGQPAEWVEAAEVKARWPWLGGIPSGALLASRDGALEPERLVQALLADARRCGAVVVEETVLGIEQHGGRVTGVIGGSERYAGGDVVLAAGAWSGQIDGVPRRVPVEPVRGQMIALPWPMTVPSAIVFGSACYLLRRGDEAIAGSTMERAGFHAETTTDGVGHILAAARTLCPALADDVRRSWAGLRPITPDGLPIIGADPEVCGLWHATGHGRNGILLAGLTGVLVAQLLAGRATTHDLTPFSPTRFQRNRSERPADS